jgi:hypothetical protein
MFYWIPSEEHVFEAASLIIENFEANEITLQIATGHRGSTPEAEGVEGVCAGSTRRLVTVKRSRVQLTLRTCQWIMMTCVL